MKYLRRRMLGGILLASLLAVFQPSVLYGTEAESHSEEAAIEETRFEATMVGVRGSVAAQAIPLTILIQGETSDEDVQKYLEIVGEGGSRGNTSELRRTLEQVRGIGRISAVGFVGTEIAIVRRQQLEEGELINLMTARNLPFAELRRGGRSNDHPFSFVQLFVDKEGNGQGTVMIAAAVGFDEEGTLEIESFGLQPFQLSNVRIR